MSIQTYRPVKGSLMALLLIPLFGACGQDAEEITSPADPIRVDAVINQRSITRFADYSNATQSTKIYPGQNVWAWALYNDNNSNTYMTAWRLTANPSGTLAGSAKYYPDNGKAIDIIAVQGNFSQTIDEANNEYNAFPTSGLTHSVKDDQRALSDYASSDLLYARVDNRKGSDNSVVTLPFKHYLSKIEVSLESTDYTLEELKHATIEIVGVQKTVTISMNNGNATTEPTVTTTGATGDILLKQGTEGNARGVGDATHGRDYIEAVVPPQELAAGNAFILVTLTSRNNRQLTYQIPASGFNTDEGFTDAEKRTLLKNRRYQFVFTLFESNITLSGATYQDGYDDQTVEVIPEA